MTNIKILLNQSRKNQKKRSDLEIKHKNVIEKAYPLPPEDVTLPPPEKQSDKVANYVMGNTTNNPFGNLKFPAKTEEPVKKLALSFSDLLNKSKEKSKEQSKRDVLFGTGLTKKIAEQEAKAHKIQLDTSAPRQIEDDIKKLDEYEKQIPPEQPPVIAVETPSEIEWDEYQKIALDGLRKQKYACLIGAAGTGKTTVTKQIVREIEKLVPTIDLNRTRIKPGERPDYNVAICFCAFTGRAVQQMKRVLPKDYHPMCNTIHATLGYAPTTETYWSEKHGEYRDKIVFRPTFTAANKLPYQVCIVDEAGMVPINLWNELIDALPKSARIILIGDINQLPPVQGRSVLGFAMINWPTYTLEHIHRQAADNPIIANAHKILHGEFPKKDNSRFAIKTLPDGSIKAYNQIIGYVQTYAKHGIFDPLRDALIVPQNIGNIGQVALNEKLVHFFNPEKRDKNGAILNKRTIITTGMDHVTFAVGDKVMLLQNDRDRGLTNGMTGVVTELKLNGLFRGERSSHTSLEKFEGTLDDDDLTSIEEEIAREMAAEKENEDDESQRQASHILTVQFGGADNMAIEFATAGQYRKITLAYAFTCHKSQGGEYPNVIIVCHASNIRMLTREWLYTAVTRAREKVILLCNDRGLAQAVNTQRIKGKTVREKAEQFLALQDQADTSLPYLPEPEEI